LPAIHSRTSWRAKVSTSRDRAASRWRSQPKPQLALPFRIGRFNGERRAAVQQSYAGQTEGIGLDLVDQAGS
jgi:hypothetical protein